MTPSTAPTWPWPSSALVTAVDRYFDLLHRGMQVNRDCAHSWVHAAREAFDGGRDQMAAVADAVAGHGEAVEAWLKPRPRELDGPR
jgi:hypothetical protein